MEKHIRVNDKILSSMLEFYSSRRVSVVDEIKRLQEELSGIDDILSQLKPSLNKPMPQQIEIPSGDYPRNGVWLDKLKYVVEKLQPVTTSEIVDEILRYEPTYAPNRKTLVPTLSGKLGENSKDGGLFKREKKSGGYYYSMA